MTDRQTAEKMKAALLSLKGAVPSLLNIEVGINISESRSAYDIVFIGQFKSREALQEFEADPFHKSVGEIVDSLKDNRHVVDFEFTDCEH